MIDAAPNVDVSYRTQVVDGTGAHRLESLVLEDSSTGQRRSVPAGGLFLLIGSDPYSEWLGDSLARDKWGFICTGPDVMGEGGGGWPLERAPLPLETSLPGVFAVGDVRRGAVKRVASAVGEGAVAIPQVHAWLQSQAAARAGAER